jgi:hypothetical protein
MDIPVDYQHAVGPVMNLSIARSYRNVIEDTKAHGSVRGGVMAGWSDECDCICGITVKDLIDCYCRPARRQPRDFEGLRADCGIQINEGNAALAQASNMVDQSEAVTAHDVLVGD